MQKVMLTGRLGRDPEVKYSQQGTAIARSLRRHHRTMEGKGRRAAGTHGVVCRESLQSPGRDRRRTPP